MQQRGGKNYKHTRFVAVAVGRLTLALTTLFLASTRLPAEELLKSPSAFDDFGKFDESKAEKWQELDSPLPAYPEDQNLIKVRMPVTYTLNVYVDEKSVSLLKDGIARFTTVVESSSGNRNVFFDGYDCESRQYKTYATGTPERTFEPIKKSSWEQVPYYETNAFRFQLMRYYVCDPNTMSVAMPPRGFIHRLKSDMNQ